MPFFSIIIPVYNAQHYIERCLESCINQTFEDIEILVVDDCGTDDSINLVQKYAKKDCRLKIIKNPYNLGLFHTRLQGFSLAKGLFCLSLDADDFLDTKICEKLAQILQRDSSIDMLHFNFKRIPSSFHNFFSIHSPHAGYLYQPKIPTFLNLSNTFQTIWGKAVKTSILQQIIHEVSFIPPPLNTLEDGVFNLLMSFKIKKYYGLNQVGYFYQKNPTSITRSVSYKTFKKKCLDFQKVLNTLEVLEKKYIQHKSIINQYRSKVLSAFFLESRFFGRTSLLKIIKLSHYEKKCPPHFIITYLPTFWISCFISLRLFYRWQTLARLLINIFTFGKIKL